MAASLSAMRNLLNALLDISRLDSGTVKTKPRTFAVQTVMDELCHQIAPEVEQNGRIELRCVPCSAHVHSDPALLEEMLSNLLFNAVKYTQEGRILLGCRRRSDWLRIDVYDTGPGIAPEHEETIFDEFMRLPDAREQERSGLGLGLSIVRRLANLLNHPVELQSIPGHGTRFSVSVPLVRDSAAIASATNNVPPPAPGNADITGGVLLVDDDEAVRDATDLFLKLEGFTVMQAADGGEALSVAEKDRPQVIIADYHLGKQNGLDIVQQLRHTLGQPKLPAILVTGESQPQLEKQAARAHCRLLLKPVDTAELVRVLRQMLSSTE